jgi:hypothetical protein
MRSDIKTGGRSTWRKRLHGLREITGAAWSPERQRVVGCDLLASCVSAAPDVFEAPVIRHGHLTVRLFRLTDVASHRIAADTVAMATDRPAIGMMLVPPRAWRYVESASVTLETAR